MLTKALGFPQRVYQFECKLFLISTRFKMFKIIFAIVFANVCVKLFRAFVRENTIAETGLFSK